MDVTDMDDFKPPVMDLSYEEGQKMDDDLDYALAYCLQTDFEEDPVPENALNKPVWPDLKDTSRTDSSSSSYSWNSVSKKSKLFQFNNEEQDSDYMLALQLQEEYAKEVGLDPNPHSISSGVSDSSLIQNGKRFKTEQKKNADHMLALKLQAEFEENERKLSAHITTANTKPLINQGVNHVKPRGDKQPASIVDPEWEILDPIPDIHSLFLQFNREYFWGSLEGVEVRWSPRMTLCAGVCSYEGRGGLCSVRLSQPLLKYRPRRDLVETLLHEMIHAYLFVTHNNKDHDAHGPEFLKHMHRINKQTGTRISVYHSFHDEVDLHRKHWWKCNGPCQRRSPFFGLVKRAMNRAPSPRDPWWAQHQATCGGTFIKIKEPENSTQKNNLKRKTAEVSTKPGIGNIKNFFSSSSPTNKENQRSNNKESLLKHPGVPNVHTISSPEKSNKVVSSVSSVVPFSGKGYVLGSSVSGNNATGTVGSHSRNSSVTRPELLGNKVSEVPSPSVYSLPQRKETKNFQSPIQKKHPSPSQSKKHPGSLNTSSKIASSGTALKFSSASGSRTVVIPKNSKAALKKPTVENSSNLPAVLFKGKGVVLGGSSTTIKEEDLSHKVVLPSPSSIKKEHRGISSLEGVFPKASGSKGNVKSEKVGLPLVKKEVSKTQTKINMYAVSPEGKNSSSVKSGSGSTNDSSVHGNVKCPVCGSIVKDFVINSHLDTCLKKYS